MLVADVEELETMHAVRGETFAVLLQPGLDNEWWADSMESHCCLLKFQDLQSNGKTPHEMVRDTI